MNDLSVGKKIFAVCCIAAVILMSACVQPLDIDSFLNDERVQDIINRDRVMLNNLTGDNLVRGNQRISGFNPDKYYLVLIEELDEAGNLLTPEYYRYITSGGTLTDSLSQIGRISGTVLTGLYNNFRYTIWSASPVEGSLLYDLPAAPSPGDPGATAFVSGNLLQAPAQNYYLDVINTSLDGIKLPIVPTGSTTAISFISDRIILLEGGNTTTDYVFFDEIDPDSFTLARVRIGERPVLGITLNPYTLPTPVNPAVPTVLNFNQNLLNTTGERVSISISNFGEFNPGSIEWHFGDVIISNPQAPYQVYDPIITSSGSYNFLIDFGADLSYTLLLNAQGTHVISVFASTGSGSDLKIYSAFILVTVFF